ncbi:MAG TPA: hypothetical protein VGR57_08440, partial [Ktedonobacterales bacterium]|nr:hypothetical protein [Ktedonobacterales bacterium]
MQPRRASAVLSLPLLVAVLAIFLAGGLGAGALARGFVDSLHPPLATATATARTTATIKSAAVTVTAGPPTAVPTQAGPDQPFLLAISATPSHVSAGAAITITVVATTKTGGKPMAGLSCALAAPRTGPTGLLSAWPAAQTTDARGTTNWTITVPSVTAGTYGVEVSAAGPDHYSFWSF